MNGLCTAIVNTSRTLDVNAVDLCTFNEPYRPATGTTTTVPVCDYHLASSDTREDGVVDGAELTGFVTLGIDTSGLMKVSGWKIDTDMVSLSLSWPKPSK